MNVNYDFTKIKNTLQDFYNAIGIRIDLLTDDFTSVSYSQKEPVSYCRAVQSTSLGRTPCDHSDAELLRKCRESRKTEVHICHAGLIDVAVPILYGEDILGYILFGQMRTESEFEALRGYVRKLRLDEGEMEKYYSEIPLFDSDKIQSVSNIASMLVKHILLENMLRPDLSESIRRAIEYINNNLSGDLSVKQISEDINFSKSVLYKSFHQHFGCTVGEYVKKQRVEKAKELLESTNLSIEVIASEVGFSSASVLSKTFKTHIGMPPIKYRKSLEK